MNFAPCGPEANRLKRSPEQAGRKAGRNEAPPASVGESARLKMIQTVRQKAETDVKEAGKKRSTAGKQPAKKRPAGSRTASAKTRKR